MAKFNFTLLYVSIVLVLAASSNANSFGPHRRGHADLGRLLKKRMPIDVLGNQSAQAQQAPATSQAVQPAQPTSAVAQTTPVNPVSVQTTPGAASASAAASPSSTNGGGLLSSIVGGLLPTESSTTSSSAVSTTTPSTSSHSSNAQISAQASQTPATTPSASILYLTTGSSSAPTPTQTSSSSSSGMSHTAMTVLIVIAACVGASVIVWTIIRKWKFRPSSDFEGRMQPIDWQPGAGNEDAALPGQRRPLSHASSFHSGSGHAHADDQMRGIGGYGATVLNPIPDHDFTAGPAHFAPVGGYADLARGASPQPMMQEPLGQAPSVNRPIQYDQYGVPLHHGYNGY